MPQRLIALPLSAVLALTLIPFGVVRAQPPQPKPQPGKAPPVVEDNDDYSYFFGKPKSVPEFWAAIKYELSVGKPNIAAMFIGQLLDFSGKLEEKKRQEEWVALEKKEGMSTFLRLLRIERWDNDEKRNEKASKDVRTLVTQISSAVKAHLEDPVRIARYVRNLTASPEEREYALGELYQSGPAIIPELVAQMRSAAKGDNQGARLALRQALLKFSKDTIPPLLAALDSNEPLLTTDVIDVLVRRGEQRAVPHLWYLLGKPIEDKAIRDAARRALSSLTQTRPDQLPQPKERLTRQADLYYQHRMEYSDPKAVNVWRWDPEKGRIVQGWDKMPTVPATKAEEYWGHRYATEALDIDSAYLPAQVVDLSLIVDKAMEQAGLDTPLSQVPAVADAYKTLLTVNPDLIIRVLERALDDKQVPVALAAVRALGELDEVRASRAGASRQSPLVKALTFGDRRVEMAAADALLRIPGKPTPGTSTRVLEVLKRALATDKEPTSAFGKVLIAYGNQDLGKQVASNLQSLGLDSVVVPTGRDALRRLNSAADIDLIVLDAAVTAPTLANLLAQLRADTHAARLPVLIAVSAEQDEHLKGLTKQFQDQSARLKQLQDSLRKSGGRRDLASATNISADVDRQEKRVHDLMAQFDQESQRALDRLRIFVERYPRTWVVDTDATLDPVRFRAVLKERFEKPENQPLPEAVRKDYAERAVHWLAKIARGEVAGYDIRSTDDVAKAIADTLVSETLSDAAMRSAIETAGRLPGALPQRQLLAFLHHSRRPIELRKLAGEELTRSIQQNGLLLGKDDPAALFELFRAPNLDKSLRPVVAGLVGLMRPDERVTGDRLKEFKPKIAPEPPPPAPPKGSGDQ